MATTDPLYERAQPDLDVQTEDVAAILEELRVLVHGFADTPPDRMTPHFYAHAFNEYDIAIRALLDALDMRRMREADR